MLQFHLGNLEFSCAAPLCKVSSISWDQNEDFPQFSGDHTLLHHGFGILLYNLAQNLDIRLQFEVKKWSIISDNLRNFDFVFVSCEACVLFSIFVWRESKLREGHIRSLRTVLVYTKITYFIQAAFLEKAKKYESLFLFSLIVFSFWVPAKVFINFRISLVINLEDAKNLFLTKKTIHLNGRILLFFWGWFPV